MRVWRLMLCLVTILLLISVQPWAEAKKKKGKARPSNQSQMDQILQELQNMKRKSNRMSEVCPVRFVRKNNMCYWFVMDEPSRLGDWSDAKNACRNVGGNLISINKKWKAQFVGQFLNDNFKKLSNLGAPLWLFTGLISTDVHAEKPYSLSLTESIKSTQSVRWSATAEAVISSKQQAGITPKAAWSPPDIEGHFFLGDEIYACVLIALDAAASGRKTPAEGWLRWRYSPCVDKYEPRPYICEIKLRRSKRKKKHGSNRKTREAGHMRSPSNASQFGLLDDNFAKDEREEKESDLLHLKFEEKSDTDELGNDDDGGDTDVNILGNGDEGKDGDFEDENEPEDENEMEFEWEEDDDDDDDDDDDRDYEYG